MKKLVAFLLLLVLLTGCASSTTQPDSSQTSTSAASSKSTSSKSTSNTAVTKAEPLSVGEVYEGETWRIQLLAAKQYEVIVDGYMKTTPDEGHAYVILFFEVENISPENKNLSGLNWEYYVDDYSESGITLLTDVDGFSSLSGNVAPGKKSRGYLALQVPNGWSEIEFSHKDKQSSKGHKLTYKITLNDLSAEDFSLPPGTPVAPTVTPTPIGHTTQNSKWKMTLSGFKVYDTILDGPASYTPDENMVYAVAFLEAENISNEDHRFNSSYFKSYVNGYSHSQISLVSDVDGYSDLTGDVAIGKKIKGYVVWMVPKDWETLEFYFDENAKPNNVELCSFMVTPDMAQ